MQELELLSPARDLQTAIAAIECGADAVYIGAPSHGARVSAANSVDDIRKLCEYAHRFRVRVYVTLNTIVYENELAEVRQMIRRLYEAGVDALIVQDMSLLEMDIPPIPLHASTQCDVRTVDKARFLYNAGFEQIVLPREMTPDEIKTIHDKVPVRLEAFVHGALCVSYSGDCRASFVNGGRSANRGECAQICRMAFNLRDGDGNKIVTDKHLLSLKDLNRINHLAELIEAGVTSFKIEGRLKSADYVRNVTVAYSTALNKFIESNPGLYQRQSYGVTSFNFGPDLSKTFNRNYTNYFIDSVDKNVRIASILTPKHVGEPIANVVSSTGLKIRIKTKSPISNGDGMGYFDTKNRFNGFRVNKFEDDTIFVSHPLPSDLKPGTILYRNYDKAFFDELNKRESTRKIRVKACLKTTGSGVCLTLEDERGCMAASHLKIEPAIARKPQKDVRRDIISKTGDTIYEITDLSDEVSEMSFIPASQLSVLRRQAVTALDNASAATFPTAIDRKRFDKSETNNVCFKSHLDMHDNIANSLAQKFYERHGAIVSERALEVESRSLLKDTVRVMTCRHCIRRELGACLKTPDGKKLKEPLTLEATLPNIRPMRLSFDCKNCLMHVDALAPQK